MSARRFKDAGSALFAIMKMELDPRVILMLVEKGEKYVLRQVCIASRGNVKNLFSEAFAEHKRG